MQRRGFSLIELSIVL
ncbi:MAG: prepilin-type N-terminal cleavage/methylation domain-containing protein, partial [Alphaproteobacteria bacterium]